MSIQWRTAVSASAQVNGLVDNIAASLHTALDTAVVNQRRLAPWYNSQMCA